MNFEFSRLWCLLDLAQTEEKHLHFLKVISCVGSKNGDFPRAYKKFYIIPSSVSSSSSKSSKTATINMVRVCIRKRNVQT